MRPSKYVNVIEVKGKFQARLQVPGDGRGGSSKRKQYPLPGLFDTPKEAAVLLAIIKRNMKEQNGGKLLPRRRLTSPTSLVPDGRCPLRHRQCLCCRRSCQWPLQWLCPRHFCCQICRWCSPHRFRCGPWAMR